MKCELYWKLDLLECTLQEFSSHEGCYRVSCIAGLSFSFVGEV